MPVELKRVTSDDVGLFDRIADGVFDEPIRRERLQDYLAEPGHLLIVAVDNSVIVGQCAAVVHRHPDKDTDLYVDELGTATSHLRQGIGRKMIDAMFDWGRELGCNESWLGTEIDNVAANALYRATNGQPNTMAYFEFKL